LTALGIHATLEPIGRIWMDVTLTPELEQFVQERVASGKNQSANDVILDALRALEVQEREEQQKLEWLRAAIDKGIASLDRGEGIPGDEVFRQLYARLAERESA
jgi:antitoxin ParD1/3/4